MTLGRGSEQILGLPDGRSVGYAVFGDPTGEVVVNCHGGLLSRNDVEGSDRAALAAGVCIVSPDRPGIGASGRDPGHGMVDWVESDLAALLDRLGVDRFAVMGWSTGGQYALAVARRWPERVTRAAVIAGCLPLDDPRHVVRLSPLDQRLIRWTREAPRRARVCFLGLHQAAKRTPGLLARVSIEGMGGSRPEDDVARHRQWFGRVIAEATADPWGAVDDYRAYASPWGFAPEEVAVPVDIHHGTEDAFVPVEWAHELGRRLPDSTVTIIEGAGHLIGVTHRSSVMQMLCRGRS